MSTTTDPQETNAPEQQGTDPPGGPSRARTTRRRRLRLVTVLVVLAAVTGVGYLLLLTIGPVALSPGQVLAALTGGGNARTINLVWDLRLPVAVTTVAIGAALGLAGSWTQTLSRNPVASPDILGVTGGASVAVVAGTVVARPEFSTDMSTFWWRALLALVGAVVIMLLLLTLGGLGSSRRVIVIGVALGLLCHGLVGYLLLRADLSRAAEAQTWLAGSTGLVRSGALLPMALGLALFVVLGASATRDLPLLAHDDATASALGVHVTRVRTVLLVAATGLVAVSVAVVGPVEYVALVAPQAVRLLAKRTAPPPVTSAVAGAAVMTVCAVIAELLPIAAPVGLITAAVGGPVLVGLVIGPARSSARTSK